MSKSKARLRSRATSTARTRVPAADDDRDPIRIVPLHVAAAAPALSPQLTYRNGPLLASVEVFTIFWGAVWNQPPQAAMIGQLNQFFDFVLTSDLVDQLSEYSVPRYAITHGKRIGTTTIITPALHKSVTDSAIQKMLQQQIASGKTVPKPTANSLYFVYIQPGVKVVMGGSASCQAFCGYHNAVSRTNIFYAVMPYPGCNGCIGSLAAFDALTSTSSHELCEAITDPIPGQGWYDDANGEIGDICAWQTKKVGSYTVQLEWSYTANRCV
jgi:hypothetical protein